MSSKNESSVARVSAKPVTKSPNKKRSAMSAKIESVSNVSSVSSVVPASEGAVATPVAPVTPVHPSLAASPAPVVSAGSVVSVQGPPKGTAIPAVPDDYVPATPGEFAAVVPRQSELSALPQALIDLSNFTDYAATLGATAPDVEEMRQSLGVGAQWSTMRQASTKWEGYASLQEGTAWKSIREQMDTLRPSFELAAKRNPKLVVKYAGLAKLLGAKRVIAQKGASTRMANKKAVAEGKTPVHGKVGKQRQRAAEKGALAAADVASTALAVTPVATPTPASPPVAAGAAVAPANGAGTNGAGH